MNERDFAKKIQPQLAHPAISPKAQARLRQSRARAVACAAEQAAPEYASVQGVIRRFWHQHHALRAGAFVVMLAVLAGGVWQWQQAREADHMLVAALLADDLPVDMLLAGSFE